MRNRSAVLALVLLFLTSVDLPSPFGGRLSAQNLEPIQFQMLFTEVPGPGTPLSLGAFAPLANPIQVADSTFGISMEGEIDLLDPRTGSMRLHFMPNGATFSDPLSFAMGFSREVSGATNPDVMMIGPLQPSNQPFQLFQLMPPPAPPMLLGATPDTWAQAGGLRLDIADVDADQSSELIFGSGPGGPGLVSVVAPGPGTRLEFAPFGAGFRGGVSIATGDITGDSHAEIVIGQETGGGEFRVFDVVGGQVRLRGIGHPLGQNFTGGIRVAVGDVDGDGLGDIITAPAQGEPRIRIFCPHGPTPIAPIADFLAFQASLLDGVFVDTGISAGRPVVVATTGNRWSEFEAGLSGVTPLAVALEELRNELYQNRPHPVNVVSAITGRPTALPLRK